MELSYRNANEKRLYGDYIEGCNKQFYVNRNIKNFNIYHKINVYVL